MKLASFTTLFFALLFTSCFKSSPINVVPKKPEIPAFLKKSTTEYGSFTDEERFFFNSFGQLIRVEEKLYQRVYEYDDAGLLLNRFTTFEENNIIDTVETHVFQYNPDGHLERLDILNYMGELRYYNTYLTDEDGRVIETQSFIPGLNSESRFITKYFWEDGNIVRQEDYDGNDNLLHEWENEYDDKINHFCASQKYIEHSNTWNQNNLTRSKAKDYTGLLDLVANPLVYTYGYLDNDLPFSIATNWGVLTILEY